MLFGNYMVLSMLRHSRFAAFASCSLGTENSSESDCSFNTAFPHGHIPLFCVATWE